MSETQVRQDHRNVMDQHQRRDEVAGAVFSAWVITGLFVDGWAHNVDKPEDFFTPWHLVLYSGFVASMVWFAIEGYRRRAAGFAMSTPRLVALGYILFAVGGVADGVWHQVFGVEVDIEALLSPTHLLLMTGGLLLVTESVRSVLSRDERAPSLRTFLPAVAGVAGAVAVLAFFTQFENAFRVFDHAIFSGRASEYQQTIGIAAILLTNALLMAALAWTARQWTTPRGTFTLIFGLTALLMSGETGFDQIWLVGAAVAGGMTADVLLARGARLRTVLVATPAVLWTAWFGVYHAVWGLGWPAELWTGATFFAVLTGFGMSLLATPPANPPHPLDPGRSVGDGSDASATPEGKRDQAPPLRTPYRAVAELLTMRAAPNPTGR